MDGTFRTPSGSRWITSDAFGAAFRSNRPSPSLSKRSRRRAAANGIATICGCGSEDSSGSSPILTIARISTQELEDFLSRMKVGAETRNTHRRDIRTLCFVSYRLASTQNAPKTALESGRDQAILFAHYRELVRPKDAERFFSIRVPCRPSSPRFAGAARTPGSSCGGTVAFCREALSCRPISRRGGGNSQEPMARA